MIYDPKGFVEIPPGAVQDRRLSLAARGILPLICSLIQERGKIFKKDLSEFPRMREQMRRYRGGLAGLLAKLEGAGYIEIIGKEIKLIPWR